MWRLGRGSGLLRRGGGGFVRGRWVGGRFLFFEAGLIIFFCEELLRERENAN